MHPTAIRDSPFILLEMKQMLLLYLPLQLSLWQPPAGLRPRSAGRHPPDDTAWRQNSFEYHYITSILIENELRLSLVELHELVKIKAPHFP